MSKIPKWASNHRNRWEYRGQKRPPFAVNPKNGQESVWDYPRPPVLDPDNRNVVVKFKGIIVAESTNAIRLLETASPPTFYLPSSDLNTQYVEKTIKTTSCEWKGKAVYWDIVADNSRKKHAAWSYPSPFDDYSDLSDYFSFYPNKCECFVDGERVRPQPGLFYGGWITSEIVGPVKGESEKTYL